MKKCDQILTRYVTDRLHFCSALYFHFSSLNYCWIFSSLSSSKDHESRDLGCLVLHSFPVLSIMPVSEHTLSKDLTNQWLIKVCLGHHRYAEKEYSIFQLRILQSLLKGSLFKWKYAKSYISNYSSRHILPHRLGGRKL